MWAWKFLLREKSPDSSSSLSRTPNSFIEKIAPEVMDRHNSVASATTRPTLATVRSVAVSSPPIYTNIHQLLMFRLLMIHLKTGCLFACMKAPADAPGRDS